jgi:hemerythrin-like domain-containing protein
MFNFTDSNASPDAIALLKQDHDEVDTMFKAYESLADGGKAADKKKLATQICDALSVHATIEEEIFYPAARRAHDVKKDLINEAAVEHQSLKDIIGRLRKAPVTDPLYDAGVQVLGEYVKHHVREEENELFPEVKRSGIDLEALGKQLLARKMQLTKNTRTEKANAA